jgi:hypothetical protein
LLSLEEILNPFLDKRGAGFGGLVMAATLVTVLVLNAVSTAGEERPVYWVTLPASAVMFAWDVGSGWLDREKTREIARKGRKEVQEARDRREAESRTQHVPVESPAHDAQAPDMTSSSDIKLQNLDPAHKPSPPMLVVSGPQDGRTHPREEDPGTHGEPASANAVPEDAPSPTHSKQHATLVSLSTDAYRWCQETFPTATAVLTHLPFALVPFAFAMFVLVQALVTKGWVPVFAWGWEHWVRKTGVVGAVGGMGFLSVILCNFAGTNIGTTILLSRVIQAWEEIHRQHPDRGFIEDRTFWATVYAMALGVNYGAFSTAFSASLAGMLWRDILLRKHIRVRSLDFARVNLPIIAISMIVGCSVLIAQVYITRDRDAYKLGS